MQRAQRIETYRQTLDKTRDERAARVQEVNQRLTAARGRLEELLAYRDEYQRALPQRIAKGLGAAALLDYQSFMTRLQAAIQAQQDIVKRIDQERDYGVQRLREVAVQHQAVSAVIDRWRDEQQLIERRREQRAIDERAQRRVRLDGFQEAS